MDRYPDLHPIRFGVLHCKGIRLFFHAFLLRLRFGEIRRLPIRLRPADDFAGSGNKSVALTTA